MFLWLTLKQSIIYAMKFLTSEAFIPGACRWWSTSLGGNCWALELETVSTRSSARWATSSRPGWRCERQPLPGRTAYPQSAGDARFHFWIVITFCLPNCLGQETAKDISFFESSCHLPIYLPYTVEASHCPFQAEKSQSQLNVK